MTKNLDPHAKYLSREKFNLNPDPSKIRNRRILITGAGGSIAKSLISRIATLEPEAIGLVDHNDSTLYEIYNQLKRSGMPATAYLGSINDIHFVGDALRSFMPDLVIHAAAYKIVPLVQEQIIESGKANVLAVERLGNLCGTLGIKDFVFVSSYEAYDPRNVFGYTKRVAEIFLTELSRVYPDTHFASVRFSLVLHSTGSVTLLFERLAKEGQPLTVTHPDAERYICTPDEAACCILGSIGLGDNGSIYTLDMGQPTKIIELAEHIKQEFMSPSEIRVIGTRPGEKILESPINGEFGLKPSDVPGLMLTLAPSWDEKLHRGLREKLYISFERRDKATALSVMADLCAFEGLRCRRRTYEGHIPVRISKPSIAQ